ncbi:MAG: response regulator [Bacteroidales bacterium]
MADELKYDWNGKTILIVEDNDNNFDLLKTFLKSTGAEVLWAQDGDESVELCRQNESINLVLMDIQLPTVSGFDATQKIREIRGNLPIVAQTAFAMVGDREKSLAAGCDDYISKPIRRKAFLDKLAKYL